MASVREQAQSSAFSKIQNLARQLVQGKNYQSEDVLTDKTKVMARRAAVGAIEAPRLQRNVRNYPNH